MTEEFAYVLLKRNKEGTIIDSYDVNDEITFLFDMIEIQERIIEKYRKELGITLFDTVSTMKH